MHVHVVLEFPCVRVRACVCLCCIGIPLRTRKFKDSSSTVSSFVSCIKASKQLYSRGSKCTRYFWKSLTKPDVAVVVSNHSCVAGCESLKRDPATAATTTVFQSTNERRYRLCRLARQQRVYAYSLTEMVWGYGWLAGWVDGW